MQILGQHFSKNILIFILRVKWRTKADASFPRTSRNDVLEPGKRTGNNEQDVRGIDLNELLIRVLSPTLRRNRGYGTFKDLEQSLLNPLT